MSEPGMTTPVQRVQPRGGRGALAVGMAILLVVGVLAWHPWGPTRASVAARPVAASPASPAQAGSLPAGIDGSTAPTGPDASTDPDLFGRLTTGPWSGRVTAEWSIVAFLRSDPVSRDPLNLRQQQVAVLYDQPESVGVSEAVCDQEGTFLHRAAADLPTREVRYLGIAYPPEESVAVRRIARLGETLTALPVELGRIPGIGAGLPPVPSGSAAADPPARTTPDQEAALGAGGLLAAGGTVPAAGAQPGGGVGAETKSEQVRMFALPGGGPWPDGVYRFDVSTHEGLPTALFACIRP